MKNVFQNQGTTRCSAFTDGDCVILILLSFANSAYINTAYIPINSDHSSAPP